LHSIAGESSKNSTISESDEEEFDHAMKIKTDEMLQTI